MIQQVRECRLLTLRGELVRNLDLLSGVIVTPSLQLETVNLQFVWQGAWLAPIPFAVGQMGSSLDQRLREIVDGIQSPRLPLQERQEHMALLARWYYSSWREEEWIAIDDPARVPYRKIVRAVSKVLSKGAGRAIK